MNKQEQYRALQEAQRSLLADIESRGGQPTEEESATLERQRSEADALRVEIENARSEETPKTNQDMTIQEQLRAAMVNRQGGLEINLEQLRAVTFAEASQTTRKGPIFNDALRGNFYHRLNWLTAPTGVTQLPVYPAVEGAFTAFGTTSADNTSGNVKTLTGKRIAAKVGVPLANFESQDAEFFTPFLIALETALYKGFEKEMLSKNVSGAATPGGIFSGTPTALGAALPTLADFQAIAGAAEAKGNGDLIWLMDAATYWASYNLGANNVPAIVDGKLLGFDVIRTNYAPTNLTGTNNKKGIALVDAQDCYAVIFPGVKVIIDYSKADTGMVFLLAEATADYTFAKNAFEVRQLA